jgi:hypothetical protein
MINLLLDGRYWSLGSILALFMSFLESQTKYPIEMNGCKALVNSRNLCCSVNKSPISSPAVGS